MSSADIPNEPDRSVLDRSLLQDWKVKRIVPRVKQRTIPKNFSFVFFLMLLPLKKSKSDVPAPDSFPAYFSKSTNIHNNPVRFLVVFAVSRDLGPFAGPEVDGTYITPRCRLAYPITSFLGHIAESQVVAIR